MDSITHLTRERIPERVVHSKAAGAFGYFEVTHDITKYCRAKLFEKVGKRTELVARLSTSLQERGSTDLAREPRGYALKFYTEDGNWDMVGFNTPVYFYKDPQYFVGFIHSQKRNPVSFVRDFNSIWDFFLNRPESLHEMLWTFSDLGIPDGYRYMSGFSIHTYELVNDMGESHFARFHFLPDQGVRNLTNNQAALISTRDPDYATRDLYNAIANGSYPSWTMYIELMTLKDVQKADFDPFDVTILWPEGRYPLLPVGRVVLNRNPKNYFADVEQVAMNPGNVVPGIPGAPDRLFQGRVLAYRDTQNYRLGINHNRIIVNCPLRASTYNRDGIPPLVDNDGDKPNYYPNSFNGPEPYVDVKMHTHRFVALHTPATDLNQASRFYLRLNEDEKIRIATNIAFGLIRSAPSVQKRTIKVLTEINADLGARVSTAMPLVAASL